MKFPVSRLYKQFDFDVTGASYAGAPRDGTMMYITAKVGHLIENLRGHKHCLCFVDEHADVPPELEADNAIIRCENPAYSYAEFAAEFEKEIRRGEQRYGYTLTEGGYYIGRSVTIGRNALIEPNVLIGHGVEIGDNAVILAGSVIKRAKIGDDFLCNENAVIGVNSFTMVEDDNGNRCRIPTLGRIVIGNHVEIGVCDNVAAGACGDTVIEDYVKLDALVYIGHEAHLHNNAEITAGGVVGGFADLKERAYLGINSSIRNRISIGGHCVIGMGSVVTKSVPDERTVVGNPARLFEK